MLDIVIRAVHTLSHLVLITLSDTSNNIIVPLYGGGN